MRDWHRSIQYTLSIITNFVSQDGLSKANESTDAIKTKRRKSEVEASGVATKPQGTKKRRVDSIPSASKAASSSNTTNSASSQFDSFRVEHLSYKRLLPGPTVLLAQIIAILPLELIVSLPEQLLGHIPITNISSTFTKRLEADVEASSDEEDDEDDEASEAGSDLGEGTSSNSKVPNLSDMFQVGQYVRASVVKVSPAKATSALLSTYGAGSRRGNEDWKGSRRCELSLEPLLVNAGVSHGDLKAGGLVLQASVKSVEDNGYVLDFGISTNSDASDKSALTSFLPFKDVKAAKKNPSWAPQSTTIGGIVTAKVSKITSNGRTCNVSILPQDVQRAQVSIVVK